MDDIARLSIGGYRVKSNDLIILSMPCMSPENLFPLNRGQNVFSQTNVLWSDFYLLVIANELDSALQRHWQDRRKNYVFVVARGSKVSELFLFAWIYVEVIAAIVFAYYHSFVDLRAGFYEEGPARFQME